MPQRSETTVQSTRDMTTKALRHQGRRGDAIFRRGGAIVCAPRRQSPTGRSVCPSGRAAARRHSGDQRETGIRRRGKINHQGAKAPRED
jgi:hypothetical protein